MQYDITPYSREIEPFVWWKNAFTDQELSYLKEIAHQAKERATAGNYDNESVLKIRRSQVSWLECNQETRWVYEKLSHVVASLNAKYYGFDLTGFAEPLQLTKYQMSEQGMYGWHQDCGSGGAPNRKLSLVMQCSDPSEYEGGNLEIKNKEKPIIVPKEKGLIAVFPSYMLHQVTPVVRGERTSLVTWISGPNFR